MKFVIASSQAVALLPRILLFACACETTWCGAFITNISSRGVWGHVLEESLYLSLPLQQNRIIVLNITLHRYLATTLQHSTCLQNLLSRTQAFDEFLPAVAAVARKAQVEKLCEAASSCCHVAALSKQEFIAYQFSGNSKFAVV